MNTNLIQTLASLAMIGGTAAAAQPSGPRHLRDGRTVIAAANAQATIGPSQAAYVEAAQVYPFSEGGIYRVYAAPGRVTDIALQPGEQLGAVASGDTVRWVIGDTTSGTGGTSAYTSSSNRSRAASRRTLSSRLTAEPIISRFRARSAPP